MSEAIRFADQLRTATAAVKLKHHKFGVRKALTAEQKQAAAGVFHADSEQLSASKKLLNTRHDAYRSVLAVRRQATEYWRMKTVAYPEPGIRLIRRESIDAFNVRMIEFRQELQAAVAKLSDVYDELRTAARQNLGELFNMTDYPTSLAGEFGLFWEYPSIEAPAYLKELNPALYEQEQQRIAARFDEAMRLTEEALAAEMHELVALLCDKLTGVNDGKPKQLRTSAVENVQAFLTRFSELNIRSNQQLDELVTQAQQAMAGTTVEGLRSDMALRATVAEKMGQVRAALDTLVVDRPRRGIWLEDEAEPGDGGQESEAA
jgi:hypothetical protein